MASKMLGRTPCPECSFQAAHVKQSDKCVYRYCPECGAQHHAKTERQRADLMGKTRMLDGGAPPTDATPTPTGDGAAVVALAAHSAPPTPSPTDATATATAAEPTPTPARRRLFG